MHTRRPVLRIVPALGAAVLLAACGDDATLASHGRLAGEPPDVVGKEAALSSRDVAPAMFQSGRDESERSGGDAAAVRQLIRRGQVTVRVEQVEPAVDGLRAIAANLGGYVGDVSVATGDEQIRHATVHLRIPAARFDEAIDAVRPLGTVQAVNVSSEDVTDQHVDLQARLANARRLEARILTLLETRTGDLQQILTAERELSRVRTEIERLDASLRRIEGLVDMSTLTVHLREPRAVLGGHAGPSIIGEAFRQAGTNFLRTVAGIITVAGALAPVLVLSGLVVVPAAVWVRRRRVTARG
jgi:hypothetical protein